MAMGTVRSPTKEPNKKLQAKEAGKNESNKKWLADAGDSGGVILIGGSSLADFRIRVAQSSKRDDMLPSFWSLAGILCGDGTFASVPLDLGARSPLPARKRNDDVSAIPAVNGVRTCSLDEIDDPKHFPNIAVIRFAKIELDMSKSIKGVRNNRSIIDLPSLILPWLGFIWGTAGSANPLMNGNGLPSSAFVETVFAMEDIELTPGLSSASSCPEAIWQSAKWWTEFYEGAAENDRKAVTVVPEGFYAIRQPSAAVEWPPEVKDPETKMEPGGGAAP
jgi:hypothetical protein